MGKFLQYISSTQCP